MTTDAARLATHQREARRFAQCQRVYDNRLQEVPEDYELEDEPEEGSEPDYESILNSKKERDFENY